MGISRLMKLSFLMLTDTWLSSGWPGILTGKVPIVSITLAFEVSLLGGVQKSAQNGGLSSGTPPPPPNSTGIIVLPAL